MGLLDKAKKTAEEGIKEHITEKITSQETLNVDKPKVVFSENRVQVLRPEGALQGIKEESIAISPGKIQDTPYPQKVETRFDDGKAQKGFFGRIKEEIEAEVRGENTNSLAQDLKSSKTRVATGIPGLDEVMGGGFRPSSVNLVAGGAGAGKTILGMQFLVNGINCCNEPGIYISFEQTEKEILEDMKSFDWGLEQKKKENKLIILTYTPDQVENVLRVGGGTVRDTIESINARRVVIDSLSAFTLLHEDALAQRKACIELFESIKKWNCTAILLSEQEEDPDTHKSSVEEFEVDSVILLYNLRKGDSRERALEIFKMRGSKHSAKIFPMTITDVGIRTFPDQTVF